MSGEKLRVGLLVDGKETSAWALKMVESLQGSRYATIELVVENAAGARRGVSGSAVRKGLDFVHARILNRTSRLGAAFRRKDLSHALRGVPVVEVEPQREGRYDSFRAEDLERIREHGLDVLVRLGFRGLRGGVLEAARHGVWSSHHGDGRVGPDGPVGLWEKMGSWPNTGAILEILTQGPGPGKVLHRSFPDNGRLCIDETRRDPIWKSLELVPEKLQELYDLGEKAFFARVEAAAVEEPLSGARSLGESAYAQLILRKAVAKLIRKCRTKVSYDYWILMFKFGDDLPGSLRGYKKLKPPEDRSWADPFLVHDDGKYHVFVEEYMLNTRKGHISVISMDEKGQCGESIPLIERPYHMSYPCVFWHRGHYYMIPESGENETIDLYKCTKFPGEWKFQMHLMSGVKAYDTTPLRYDGKWWLFTTFAGDRYASAWDNLHLYSSENLFSQNWAPHPLNPVVRGNDGARCAGNIFLKDGKLYRPSQNCEKRYGHSFNFSEITRLTETEYEETLLTSVGPRWNQGIVGTHTFNQEDGLSVTDVRLRALRLGWRAAATAPAAESPELSQRPVKTTV